MFNIRTFSLGELGTNAYLISSDSSDQCLVVDCPPSPEALIRTIRQSRLKPRTLFLTHGHFDHLGGVEDFRAAFPEVEVAIHSQEADFLLDPKENLSAWWSLPVTCKKAEVLVEEGSRIILGDQEFQVIHTPGHSPGSSVLHHSGEKVIFAGDLIFRDSVGRSDFPHSEPEDLRKSLKHILSSLPEETRIYPGHGPSTTLGREKKLNPYLMELQ